MQRMQVEAQRRQQRCQQPRAREIVRVKNLIHAVSRFAVGFIAMPDHDPDAMQKKYNNDDRVKVENGGQREYAGQQQNSIDQQVCSASKFLDAPNAPLGSGGCSSS